MVPPGVISALPVVAVAPVNTNVPCPGATSCVHVRVWLASASFTCSSDFISVAAAFCVRVSACGVLSVYAGAILLATEHTPTTRIRLFAASAMYKLPTASISIPYG